MNPLLLAVILAAICAVLVEEFIRLYPRGKTAYTLFREVRKTGVRAIYLRKDSDQLESMLRGAKKGDEILVVGRTQSGFLKDNEKRIMEALDRGIILKLLFLDRKTLESLGPGQRIDLRFLRVPNAHGQLLDDVGETESRLRSLRNQCQTRNLEGSLLVYRTGVLVQSSVVIYLPRDEGAPMRILYDFSFGIDDSEKFVQCYKSPRISNFFHQLRKFYAGMFDQDVSSLSYELSYSPSAEHDLRKELERLAAERIRTLIGSHSQSEAIRDNTLIRIVPAAREIFKALNQNNTPVPPPVSAQIELTNQCTTSCTHCFRFSKSQAPQMNPAMAMKLLDELSDLGVRTITFSGGEPTTHSEFIGLLRHASLKNLGVGVLSNGVGIGDEVLQAIHDNARWLRLSIDGSTAAVYGQVRRSLSPTQDAFQELNSTIQRFKRLNDITRRCALSICYTIQRNNVEDVRDMIKWVQRLDLPGGDKCLTFKFAHGSNGFLCTQKQLRDFDRDVLKNSYFAGAANLDYLSWFLKEQSSIHDLAQGRPSESLYLQQKTRCFTPHLFTLIDPEGNVYTCCFLFEDNKGYGEAIGSKRREHCIGNVENNIFGDIWRGAEYQRVRGELAIIKPKTEKYSACGECTRHCNHNKWLSQIYAEYSGLLAAGGDADAVMMRIAGANTGEVWL